MKYFFKFTILLLCMTVLTGYEVLAQQNTDSPSQTNDQTALLNHLEDVESFYTLVGESDNVQCTDEILRSIFIYEMEVSINIAESLFQPYMFGDILWFLVGKNIVLQSGTLLNLDDFDMYL